MAASSLDGKNVNQNGRMALLRGLRLGETNASERKRTHQNAQIKMQIQIQIRIHLLT